MAQVLADRQNIEKEAWELFEVGSYEEIVSLSFENPGNALLADLAALSRFHLTSKLPVIALSHTAGSVFTPLVKAYELFHKGQKPKACEKISEYFSSKNPPVCFTIADFAVKLTSESGKFTDCLFIILYYSIQEKKNPFITEEIDCLFELKKFQELVEFFRKNFKELSQNFDNHRKCGIALTMLGKYRESEALLRNIPGRKELPTFQEKQKEFAGVIRQIPAFEKKSDLSRSELNDLGFAYLFNSDYQKAERIFVKAASLTV